MSLLTGVSDLILDSAMGAESAAVSLPGGGSGTVSFLKENLEQVMDENDTHATELSGLTGLVSLSEYTTKLGRAPKCDDTLTIGGVAYKVSRAYAHATEMVGLELVTEAKKEALAKGDDVRRRSR